MIDPPVSAHQPLLAVQAATRRHGRRILWRDVSCALQPGEVVLLAGANGVGKTTLLRTCAGLMRPTSGSIRIAGGDPFQDRTLGGLVGYLGHGAGGYRDLTARENLAFLADLHGLSQAAGRIAFLLERVGLTPHAQQRVGTFSRGMVQRLAIARLVLHTPSLLLLDEPFAALDTAGADMLRDLLAESVRQGAAVFCATHDAAELDRLATRRLVLADGTLREDAHAPGVTVTAPSPVPAGAA